MIVDFIITTELLMGNNIQYWFQFLVSSDKGNGHLDEHWSFAQSCFVLN